MSNSNKVAPLIVLNFSYKVQEFQVVACSKWDFTNFSKQNVHLSQNAHFDPNVCQAGKNQDDV